MDIVEEIEREVLAFVDEAHYEVIERLLQRFERLESAATYVSPMGCPKYLALRIYVAVKLSRHRLRKLDHDWANYRGYTVARDVALTEQIRLKRIDYYDRECLCGKCRAKPNPFRH